MRTCVMLMPCSYIQPTLAGGSYSCGGMMRGTASSGDSSSSCSGNLFRARTCVCVCVRVCGCLSDVHESRCVFVCMCERVRALLVCSTAHQPRTRTHSRTCTWGTR
jgi:hypothetical protein